jgi:hypothetical protein
MQKKLGLTPAFFVTQAVLIKQQRRFLCIETKKPWPMPEIPDLLEELGSEEEKKQPSLKIPGY